ncbi:hypothetical protein [Streptococcus ferus]|nr:hypothetical protein [Streptococcus ferus]
MSKKYANEENIQIAMSEYNEDIGVNNELWTQNGTFVGYTS